MRTRHISAVLAAINASSEKSAARASGLWLIPAFCAAMRTKNSGTRFADTSLDSGFLRELAE